MTTIRAYRYALDLTPAQQRQVLAHAGAARVAHNWALARVKAVMDQRAAERSYGVPDEQLTESLSWSLPALRKAWNGAKAQVAPWWSEVSKEAFNTGLDALARGLKNFSDSRTGKRAGRPVGFPRFKSRRRTTPSVRFTTGAIRVEPDRMHVVLPRLGRLKLHESARKLARRIDNDTARIMSATVRCDAGRWYVSYTVAVERAERSPARPASTVGVDVGITHLAVLSTGELVANPRHLTNAQRRLRTLGRALSRKVGPDRRTGRRPSNRWQRAAARLAKAHARVANQRRDGLHKLTTRLAREHATIVVEDLNVAGMLANRRLARHIADAGFAEIRRQLAYKTEWHGGRLLVADRWYPSSKTCSGCGTVKTKLALSERDIPLRRVWPGPGPGPERCPQPGRPRGRVRHRREWPGGRTWSRPEDPRTRAGGYETSTRHGIRRSDRDRPTARRDYQQCAHQSTLKGNGYWKRVLARPNWGRNADPSPTTSAGAAGDRSEAMEQRIRKLFRRMSWFLPLLRPTGLAPRMNAEQQADSNIELGKLSRESELGPVLDNITVPIRYVVASGTSFGSRGDEQERIRTGLDAATARNPNIRISAKVGSNHGAILKKDFPAVAAAVREVAALDPADQ